MKRYERQIGLYLGNELFEQVRAKADEIDRKLSEIIRTLLRKWVSGQIKI